MFKKILFILAGVVALLLLVEIIALLQLKSHLKSYADYWKNLPNSGSFTYVALGDSAAQGIGASKPQYGYVGLLSKYIQAQTGQKVRVVNLSVSGAKIEDVLAKQIPQLQKYKADLVTVDIGANDVAGKYNSTDFARKYDQLAAALPAGTIVGNTPYFGGRIRHNTQALDANKHIAASAQKYDLRVADLQTVTRAHNSLRVYAPDLFHPSNQGYKNWATAYEHAMSQPFLQVTGTPRQ
ncbi:MAG TPA: SGNH/GDSL hydrolase family protein [Candidatus Saccharimonadales bacterium]